MSTAVVVGSGPNGLAAAIHLARNGIDVQLIEAADRIGGGLRSGELTVPGVIHDHCAAIHPMAAGSPFLTGLDLERFGLMWRRAEIDCAHPLDNGEAGLLYRSLETTATTLGIDGQSWRALLGAMVEGYDELAAELLRPIVHLPRHPLRLAGFGPRALLPATMTAQIFRTERAKALFGGVAAHFYSRMDRPASSAVGLMIAAAGHRYGWPVAEGGSQAIATALETVLRDHGGKVDTGVRIRSAADIPSADLVLLDVSPATALTIYGDRIPHRISRAFTNFRRGPGAYKVDFAIDGEVPWTNPSCARAVTVHLGGSFAETAATEKQVTLGRMPERPFVLVGQQFVADPTRSANGINPLYAYAHVPQGYSGDATEAVTTQIERFAPGFRDRIVATVSSGTGKLSVANPNNSGGDIIGGANAGLQVVFRPRVALDPYRIGVPGVYLCSSSTPPGAGAHGMCGFFAAQSALRYLRRRSGLVMGKLRPVA